MFKFGNSLCPLLSCVIRHVEKPLPYIVCLEGRARGADPDDWKQLAQDCYLHLDIDSDTITITRTCANGPEGDALQRAAGHRTYSIEADPMTFVPWILWNNGSNKEVQEESREDLKPFICGHLKKANIDQANCA
ncbi:Interferon, gamma-inducible protein 30 [Globodera pallida]|nr:Interferon, gamma-inducible protein 30 [Globodera pallida]